MQALPATGTYTVLVVPNSGATGTAQVTVWNEVVAVLVGTPTTQTVRFPNQKLRLAFTGAVGDNVGVDLANLTLASGGVAQGATVQVFAPSGAVIAIGPQASGGQISATYAAGTVTSVSMQALPATGTYTVLVVPNGGATGTAQVTVFSR
jgi:hypothetical protein